MRYILSNKDSNLQVNKYKLSAKHSNDVKSFCEFATCTLASTSQIKDSGLDNKYVTTILIDLRISNIYDIRSHLMCIVIEKAHVTYVRKHLKTISIVDKYVSDKTFHEDSRL